MNSKETTSSVSSDDASLLSVAHWLLIGYCLAAALSIAASQIFVGAFILCIAAYTYRSPTSLSSLLPEHVSRVLPPLLLFFFTGYVAALCGVDTMRSVRGATSTVFMGMFPLCVALFLIRWHSAKISAYLLAIITGQSLAALHSIVQAALAVEALWPKIPGPVTESGQLVLTLPLLFACALRCHHETSQRFAIRACTTATLFIATLAGSFQVISLEIVIPIALTAIGVRLWSAGRTLPEIQCAIVDIAIALLPVALVVNMKRGPWLAVCIELLVFGVLYSRVFLVCGGMFVAIVSLVSETRQRIIDSIEHFFIGGGRFELWKMGGELTERFPLGIGPNNSRFIQKLDPTLPELHRHLHNTFLNILLEYGWIGLAAFVWLLIVLLRLAFEHRRQLQATASQQLLCAAIGTGYIGLAVAGLVEHNIGDGEIRLLFFFSIGALLAVTQSTTASRGASSS